MKSLFTFVFIVFLSLVFSHLSFAKNEKSSGANTELAYNSMDIQLKVDYKQSFQKMIKASGYDWINKNVNLTNFPLSVDDYDKVEEVEIRMFWFDSEFITTEEILQQMKNENCRPANLFELATLNYVYPRLRERGPIIALGSVWERTKNKTPCVPYVDVKSKNRSSLHMVLITANWAPNYCCFIAVVE